MNSRTVIKMIVKEITKWTDFFDKIYLTLDNNIYIRRPVGTKEKGGNKSNYPIEKPSLVTFENSNLLSSASKLTSYNETSYNDIYLLYLKKGIYNIITRDGAMIQIEYRFKNRQLIYHRLAFFPALSFEVFWGGLKKFSQPDLDQPDLEWPDLDQPDLEWPDSNDVLRDLDQDPMLAHLGADINDSKIVRFPLRFDYDDTISKTQTGFYHPKVHLTLGEYTNCRIPLPSPLTPSVFFDFILRNFYSNTYLKHRDTIPGADPKLSKVFSQLKKPVTNYKGLYIDYKR